MGLQYDVVVWSEELECTKVNYFEISRTPVTRVIG